MPQLRSQKNKVDQPVDDSTASKQTVPNNDQHVASSASRTSEEQEESPSPVKKAKARKSGSKGKGKKRAEVAQGACKILEFPTDLLYETCKSLDPASLLALSRTCKTLQGYLTSKASKPIWTVARRAVGLPELECKFSEAYHAFLVFGTDCQLCKSRKPSHLEHNLLVRLCSQCLKDSLVLKRDFEKTRAEEHDDDVHLGTFTCLPSTPYRPTNGDRRNDKLVYYYLPSIVRMSDKLFAIEVSEDNGIEGVLEGFVAEQKAHIRLMSKDASKIYKWQSNSIEDNLKVQDGVIAQRKKDIEAKMLAAGFTRADINWNQYPETALKPFHKPKALTDQEWKRSVWPALQSVATERKNLRLAREAADRKWQRQAAMQPMHRQLKASQTRFDTAFFPSFGHFLELPKVKTFWEPDSAFDRMAWTSAETQSAILDEMEALISRKRIQCYNAVLSDTPERDAPTVARMEKVLAVATNAIQCGCSSLHTWPGILQHRNNDFCDEQPKVHHKFVQAVKQMLMQAALPWSFTHADLHALGNVFKCGCGALSNQWLWSKAPVDLSWTELMGHALESFNHRGYYRRNTPIAPLQFSIEQPQRDSAGEGAGSSASKA